MSRIDDTHIARKARYHYCLRDSFLEKSRWEGSLLLPARGNPKTRHPPTALFLSKPEPYRSEEFGVGWKSLFIHAVNHKLDHRANCIGRFSAQMMRIQ